jgi:hypothetical protein
MVTLEAMLVQFLQQKTKKKSIEYTPSVKIVMLTIGDIDIRVNTSPETGLQNH